jgi:uncharacterized RDD family membrane protein YckC
MDPKQKYSTGGLRLAAAFVDGLVLGEFNNISEGILENIHSKWGDFFWMVIATLVGITYSVFFHYRSGQTPGKMAFKLKVMNLDEINKITLKQAILRDIFSVIFHGAYLTFSAWQLISGYEASGWENMYYFLFISGISLFWVLVELLSMLTNDKRRAIHDFIARTVVIRTDIS